MDDTKNKDLGSDLGASKKTENADINQELDPMELEIREKLREYDTHLTAVLRSLQTWESPHDTPCEKIWRTITSKKLSDLIVDDIYSPEKYCFSSNSSAKELMLAYYVLKMAGQGTPLSKLIHSVQEEFDDDGINAFLNLLHAGLLDYAYVMPAYSVKSVLTVLQNRAIQIDETFAACVEPGKVTAVLLQLSGVKTSYDFNQVLKSIDSDMLAVKRIDISKEGMYEWQMNLDLGSMPKVLIFDRKGELFAQVHMCEELWDAIKRAEEKA
jgi:hypothetical protein